MTQVTLKECTVIVAATYGNARSIRFADPTMGTCDLWTYHNEHGIAAIVGVPDYVSHNGAFEHAHEEAVDLLPEVEVDDLYEAYGFDSPEEFKTAADKCAAGEGDYPELAEGYTTNSCAEKTGVVWVGHYEGLYPLTTEAVREHGIALEIVLED